MCTFCCSLFIGEGNFFGEIISYNGSNAAKLEATCNFALVFSSLFIDSQVLIFPLGKHILNYQKKTAFEHINENVSKEAAKLSTNVTINSQKYFPVT